MKKCEKCNININTSKKQCPICFNELDGEYNSESPQNYNLEKYSDNTPKKNVLLMQIFTFLTIVIMTLSLFINFLTTKEVWWSAIVVIGLIYVWILIRHTILSRRGNFEKILFQFAGIFGIVLAANMISGGLWFWNYFVPSASIVTITVLLFLLLINKKRSDFTVSFFFMSILLLTLSIVLICLPVDDFKLLNLINIIYTGLFILGILIFGFRSLKRGLQKNWHV